MFAFFFFIYKNWNLDKPGYYKNSLKVYNRRQKFNTCAQDETMHRYYKTGISSFPVALLFHGVTVEVSAAEFCIQEPCTQRPQQATFYTQMWFDFWCFCYVVSPTFLCYFRPPHLHSDLSLAQRRMSKCAPQVRPESKLPIPLSAPSQLFPPAQYQLLPAGGRVTCGRVSRSPTPHPTHTHAQ